MGNVGPTSPHKQGTSFNNSTRLPRLIGISNTYEGVTIMQLASKRSAVRLLRTFVTASSKHQSSASSIEQRPESKPSSNSVTGPGPPPRVLPGPGLSHFLEDNYGRFHN